MNSLLAAIDFSPVSKSIVRQAIELAGGLNAKLTVLHVVRPPTPAATEYSFLVQIETGVAIIDAMQKHAANRLRRLRTQLAKHGIRAEVLQAVGDPAALVLERAAKLPADCIILGSHGHSSFYDLVIGSVAQKILRRAKCPVLIVPARKIRPKMARRIRRPAIPQPRSPKTGVQ